MKKKSVFILGCGWLGKAVGNSLSRHGYEVSGSTTTSARMQELTDSGIRPVTLDIGNRLVRLSDVLNENSWLILSLPPAPLASSVDWLTSELSEINKLKTIMISSTAVYPLSDSTVFEEDAIHKVSSHSGIDLLAVEEAVSNACETIVLRPGGLYGPGRHPGRFLAGKTGLTNGLAPVNLIHQDDIVNIITLLIAQDTAPGVYNAVAPGHPTRKEFYTKAARSARLTAPHFSPMNEAGAYKIVDSSRIIHKLNYTFLHPDPMEDL